MPIIVRSVRSFWLRTVCTRVASAVVKMNLALVGAAIVSTVGCGNLTDVPDPTTIVDPRVVQTQDGAVALYRGAITQFASVFAGFPIGERPSIGGDANGHSFAQADALAGDQLVVTGGANADNVLYNLRRADGVVGDALEPYGQLHKTRVQIDQAVGALRQYGMTTPPSFIAELIALRGFLYVMFGEMYCSGVPFSQAVYGGDITLGAGETTTEMFEHAIMQFDSAIAIATDSVHVRRMATIGKARALLNLGRFADAAALVPATTIPTEFAYRAKYGTVFPNYLGAITDGGTEDFGVNTAEVIMPNRLGVVGLDYLSAGDTSGGRVGDPRVLWVLVQAPSSFPGYPPGPAVPVPGKFPTGSTPVTLAGGIEARLIEAEAALHDGNTGTWSAILDELRQTAITPAIPALTADSTTNASPTLRENVMFRERALWLYAEGHRLGDMRRLVRQYDRTRQSVFPQGPHPEITQQFIAIELRTFSNQMNFVPPRSEQQTNPYYHGCFNRDA